MPKQRLSHRTRRWLVAGLVALAVLGSLAFRLSGPSVVGTRAVPSFEEAPRLPADQGLRFLALGDTGMGNRAQFQVGRAMAERAADRGADFVLLLGDNFYPDGVSDRLDSQWRTAFLEPYASPSLQVPFYAALGNHDHHGNVEAQVNGSLDCGVWRMPARTYSFRRTIPGAEVEAEFFVLDTTPIHRGWEGYEEQLAWIEAKLGSSRAAWKIVIGHHPVVSGGRHGGSEATKAALLPLFDAYGVDLYLSGHDHDMQLLDIGRSTTQLVCGTGAKLRSVEWLDDAHFAAVELGFVWLRIDARELWIEFLNRDSASLYSHRIPASLDLHRHPSFR